MGEFTQIEGCRAAMRRGALLKEGHLGQQEQQVLVALRSEWKVVFGLSEAVI